MWLHLIPGMALLALAAYGGIWCYRHEKRLWNGGTCCNTGEPWVLFDRDSQGGRGYVSGSNRIWISYNVDK